MLLTRLQVENYKGIRSADVSFDETTVLIGENETGKGTLFEILREILNPLKSYRDFEYTRDRFHLHNNEPAGDISITLTFSEMESHEWDTIEEPAFQELLTGPERKRRRISLRIGSKASGAEVSKTEWQLFNTTAKAVDRELNEKLIPWIRKYKRVIFIHAGLLTGMMSPDEAGYHRAMGSMDHKSDDPIIQDVLSYATRILTDTSTDNTGDVRKGFQAACAYIHRYDKESKVRRRSFGLKIGSVIGRTVAETPENRDIHLNERKTIAQQLGVLLLTAAWIKLNPENGNDHVDPIAILEDPEAHLHPITMACTTELFSLIRWQKLIATYSAGIVSEISLTRLRRLTMTDGKISEHRVREHALSREDLRKVGYHLGARNHSAWFSRVWLLVEGESEYWIIPHIAQKLEYNFHIEGVCCIEFAQSGLTPIIKLAEQLGIQWHVLVDGDEAGVKYLEKAQPYLEGRDSDAHITALPERDIENHFWHNGYDFVYMKKARVSADRKRPNPPYVINKAIRRYSKPYLSLSIVDAVFEEDSPGIPPVIEKMLHTVVRLARTL